MHWVVAEQFTEIKSLPPGVCPVLQSHKCGSSIIGALGFEVQQRRNVDELAAEVERNIDRCNGHIDMAGLLNVEEGANASVGRTGPHPVEIDTLTGSTIPMTTSSSKSPLFWKKRKESPEQPVHRAIPYSSFIYSHIIPTAFSGAVTSIASPIISESIQAELAGPYP
jgi:hypothetical protein